MTEAGKASNIPEGTNFIEDIITADLAGGKVNAIHTRFPPEPNGCLHIGSAKAIVINFSAAKRYGGLFNLRFDDTDPVKEDDSYAQSIADDVEWLIGEKPGGGIFYGSDYFQQCYEFAVKLIKDGKAYVCDLPAEEMSRLRGTVTETGKPSPYRDRTVEENLALFERMKNGEFPNGHCVLRAKIDMASPNMLLRDPPIYRINHTPHYRHGSKWKIYPLYDYAHPIQDALEGITHSLCSIEFETHRPLYDWVVENIGFDPAPHQYEFARLNLTYTVMSKRYLRKLVETNLVDGWDDPRLPTLSGLRRRGYSPEAIRRFVHLAGINKAYSMVDAAMLEYCVREELGASALRRIAVLDPIAVTIENFPEDKTEYFNLPNNPSDPEAGTRQIPFTKHILIEREDFSENPPPKFHRLKPGGEVRLMGAYIIKLQKIIKDEKGDVTELICTADLETRDKNPTDGRKVKGTVHWLSARHTADFDVVNYDRLFNIENVFDIPEDKTYDDYLNRDSARQITGGKFELSLLDAKPGERFQFVRLGYYVQDSKHPGRFNSIVPLKSSFKL
jgi:glutaminyl-tRNA synthetase